MLRFPFLLASLFFLTSGLSSQTIVITFEGTLNEAPTPLDSIRVMNLTQGGDTTIYFPDNMLVLSTVGISEARSRGRSMHALPNPFAGSTEVVVHSNGGAALITLHDVAGRTLVTRSANLPAGIQRLRVTCEGPGVHLLTVVQGGVRSALRLTAMEGDGVAGISLVGGADHGAPKSDRSMFTWAPGDALRYIGYATDGDIVHSAVIDEVPEATASRTFDLFVGLACPESPFVTDIDGNVYPAVQVGTQCWMAANLKTTRYRNGTTIPNVTDNTAWSQLNNGAWCNYHNDIDYDAIYGKLYNWYAAANPNMCPQGWHVPTEAEWQQLESEMGMPSGELGLTGMRGTVYNVGGKLKTNTLWAGQNFGATNEIGFSGLPGGSINLFSGTFLHLGLIGLWWSVSENGPEYAWARAIHSLNYGIERDFNYKFGGLSLRCVKD